jgi:hypothetical protein
MKQQEQVFKVVAEAETSTGAEISAEAELIMLSFMFHVII